MSGATFKHDDSDAPAVEPIRSFRLGGRERFRLLRFIVDDVPVMAQQRLSVGQ